MLENVRSGFATLEKKLYRLVITALDGDRIGEASYCRSIFDLAEKGIRGFIVSGGTKDDLKSFLESLREYDLFVVSEMSDCSVGRVRGFTEFPSFMALAAAAGDKDPQQLSPFKQLLTALAGEVMDCGINLLVVGAADQSHGEAPFEADNSARIRRESIRALQDTGLLVYENCCLPDGGVSCRPALNCMDVPAQGLTLAILGSGRTGRGLAAYLDDGADILVDLERPGITVQELADAVRNGMIAEEQIDMALARIEAVKLQVAGPPEIEVDQVMSELLSREISQMAVTMVKGKGRFFPLRESDNIPLVYAGEEEYFRTSPLRFYVKQASHIKRPLSSKERPAMFLLFGDAAAEELAAGSETDELESLSRLIRATSPSVVVSFGSPRALTRFKDADVLIAAYDSTGYAQEAVFKCVTGERGFEGQLPVLVNIQDKKGRQQ